MTPAESLLYGNYESTSLSRDNLSREMGRTRSAVEERGPGPCGFALVGGAAEGGGRVLRIRGSLPSLPGLHKYQASLSGTDRTPFEKKNRHVPKIHLYGLINKD